MDLVEAVFRLAELARMAGPRAPSPAGIDWGESVHLAIQAETLRHLAAIDFQAAAVIVQRHVADARHGEVRDLAGRRTMSLGSFFRSPPSAW